MQVMNKKTLALSTLILGLSAVIATPASAGSLQVVINGMSHHIDAQHDWNEANYGIGVEYEFEPKSRWIKTALANGFVDSNDNMSYMAGAGLHRRLFTTERFRNLYIDTGLTAFMMTRQDIDDGRPFPGVLPSVTVGNRYLGLNLSYVPPSAVRDFAKADVVDPTIDGVLFLQFKFRLDGFLPD